MEFWQIIENPEFKELLLHWRIFYFSGQWMARSFFVRTGDCRSPQQCARNKWISGPPHYLLGIDKNCIRESTTSCVWWEYIWKIWAMQSNHI